MSGCGVANDCSRRPYTAFSYRDALHKLTTRLAKTHGVMMIEDLNIRGMMKKRGLIYDGAHSWVGLRGWCDGWCRGCVS